MIRLQAVLLMVAAGLYLLCREASEAYAASFEVFPSTAESCNEEFLSVARRLQPGDELILHDGVYSQDCRRAITLNGEPGKPITIRAAAGARPILTRSAGTKGLENNIDIIESSHVIIRGLTFRGGSIGIRFIGGHHITIEDCEIFETQNNAMAVNRGNASSLLFRRNHIYRTGLYASGPTEGEGMYIGCHDGSCRVTGSIFEGNYIHHLRGTSSGGNDGIEIKPGSYGNIVRDNVIHDANIEKQFPCIFVYGGGPAPNVVERNVVWNCGEGIQVVGDAVIRNNIILNSSINGITAAPHAANRRVRNVTIVNNTIVGHPKCLYLRWRNAENMVLANNAVYCPGGDAVDAEIAEVKGQTFRANYVEGRLGGVRLNSSQFISGGTAAAAFMNPDKFDFWPRATSPLIRKGDVALAPQVDFNQNRRNSRAVDIGAYERRGLKTNPGWKIVPGFKEKAS